MTRAKKGEPRCAYCKRTEGQIHLTETPQVQLHYHPLCWLKNVKSTAKGRPEPLAADLIALLQDAADRARAGRRLHPAFAVVLDIAAECIAGQYGVPGEAEYERLLLRRPTPPKTRKPKPERRNAA